MKKYLLILCVLIAGCSFSRSMSVKAGADGAKAKVYGELESGQMVYNSTTTFNLFGCK